MNGSSTIPPGWRRATVGDLAAHTVIGLVRNRGEQGADPCGLPYVKMNNITNDGRVTFDDVPYVSASPDEEQRFCLTDGDLLFNTRNSVELVG